MQRWTWFLLALLWLPWSGSFAMDRAALPPAQREFLSPAGNHVLRLETADAWRTPRATASLFLVRDSGRKLLWKQELPHHHGPRMALVTDRGEVVLLDEWINVLSRHALVVFDAKGREVAHHQAEALFTLLGIPPRDISAQARFGTWISAAPTLSGTAGLVLIPTAGRTLVLRISDGSLSVRP